MATEVNEYSYDELLDLTARYNKRIHNDKLSRLPFLDNATGIAQRPCFLYRRTLERDNGFLTKVFQYPPMKWKKSQRCDSQPVVCPVEVWNGLSTATALPLISNPTKKEIDDEDTRSTWVAASRYGIDSDTSDTIDETYGNRRKRKRTKQNSRINRSFGHSGSGTSRRRPQNYQNFVVYDEDSNERSTSNQSFVCDICGSRYRSRTGLTYHFNSHHRQVTRVGSSRVPSSSSSSHPETPVPNHQGNSHHSRTNGGLPSTGVPLNATVGSHSSTTSRPSGLGLLSSGTECTRNSSVAARSRNNTLARGSSIVESSSPACSNAADVTCDFCLGDAELNKKTGQSEGMLRCSDCGRCAHFSCLQFTANMIASVRTYRWQCIECKTCWLCGTSENDEQMLFCDDCDRGYHMYCLTPPLSEPPEGSWSCKLCVDHFRDLAASNQPSVVDNDGETKTEVKSTGTNCSTAVSVNNNITTTTTTMSSTNGPTNISLAASLKSSSNTNGASPGCAIFPLMALANSVHTSSNS